MTRTIFLPLFLASTLASHGYDFLTTAGLRWRDGDIEMNLQLNDTRDSRPASDSNISWNDVAQQAIDIWNEQLSHVQFATYSGVGRGDGNDHNEVFFSPDIYGHRFGEQVLAVTSTWRIGSERVEGDTIFNSTIEWDSYRGPIVDYFTIDLRRVAAHEFGHTLGLDHPDQARQVVVALMNSVISDLDTIATDDIHGVRALYPPVEKFTLNFNVLPAGSGDVLAAPAPDMNHQYPAGTLVTLTAKPHRKFRFNFWGGDEYLAARKLKVFVVDDETITVNFSTNGAPVVRTQPRSQFASYYDTVTLGARVSSRPPTAYQWQHDGADVPGATSATLVLPFVTHEDSGLYSLRVTNARGETFSKPARVIVEGY